MKREQAPNTHSFSVNVKLKGQRVNEKIELEDTLYTYGGPSDNRRKKSGSKILSLC